MELRLDLHIHSRRSPDGCMSMSEIVARAKEAGLNGVAVCDHGLVLTDPPETADFLVIPGVEVSTEYGHLLGLFVTGPVDTRDFRQAAERIHQQGGLAVLAHPFLRSAPLRGERRPPAPGDRQRCHRCGGGGADDGGGESRPARGTGPDRRAAEQSLVHRPEPAEQAPADRGGLDGLSEMGGLCPEVPGPGRPALAGIELERNVR